MTNCERYTYGLKCPEPLHGSIVSCRGGEANLIAESNREVKTLEEGMSMILSNFWVRVLTHSVP